MLMFGKKDYHPLDSRNAANKATQAAVTEQREAFRKGKPATAKPTAKPTAQPSEGAPALASDPAQVRADDARAEVASQSPWETPASPHGPARDEDGLTALKRKSRQKARAFMAGLTDGIALEGREKTQTKTDAKASRKIFRPAKKLPLPLRIFLAPFSATLAVWRMFNMLRYGFVIAVFGFLSLQASFGDKVSGPMKNTIGDIMSAVNDSAGRTDTVAGENGPHMSHDLQTQIAASPQKKSHFDQMSGATKTMRAPRN